MYIYIFFILSTFKWIKVFVLEILFSFVSNLFRKSLSKQFSNYLLILNDIYIYRSIRETILSKRWSFKIYVDEFRVRSRYYPKISRQIRRAYQISVPERSLLHYRRRNFHSLQFEKSDSSLFFLRIREIRRVVGHQFTMISFFEMKIVRKRKRKKEKEEEEEARIELWKILSLDIKKKKNYQLSNERTVRICK